LKGAARKRTVVEDAGLVVASEASKISTDNFLYVAKKVTLRLNQEKLGNNQGAQALKLAQGYPFIFLSQSQIFLQPS